MTIPYVPSDKTAGYIIDFHRHCTQVMQTNWNLRSHLERLDRIYMREVGSTRESRKARAFNEAGDPRKFQDIVMPVVMPQVENAVTYQQSVFLSGTPIFSCVSNPEFAAEAAQLDTIFAEQEIKGNWSAELLKCMRDGFKYNLMGAEVDWSRETTVKIETDAVSGIAEGKAKEIIWEGNKIKHLDMYNTFWDTRVKPIEVAKHGEFAGYHELMGRVRFKQFVNDLPMKLQVSEAFKAGSVANTGGADYGSFYIPQLNPNNFIQQQATNGMNWAAWAGYSKSRSTLEYQDSYLVTTLYARILPSDMEMRGVPGQNTPQVWKFIVINNRVVLYAERCTNAHNMLPIHMGQILDDGLGYQTKSFADNVTPFQQITTALANSTIASRRRAISDRTLYDPSRISAAALNNDSPTANIPVRPAAYGKPLSEAVYPFPFRDDQFQINMAEIQSYLQLADRTSGLNPARQGQFVKGNKTKFEYADVMANANGRDMTISLMLEGNFFTPIKEMLKINVLQFQRNSTVVRPGTGDAVVIDPVALRNASLVLKVTDGLTPSDKIIDGDTLTSAVQTFSSIPEIGQEYNMGDMVAHLFSSRGLKLAAYKKSPPQIAYEQAVGQWQQGIQMLAEGLAKSEMAPEQLEQALAAMPQPTPEQFGYVPGTKGTTPGAATSSGPGILSSMQEVVQQSIQAAQPAPDGATQEGISQ